jgi:hypothetical protein
MRFLASIATLSTSFSVSWRLMSPLGYRSTPSFLGRPAPCAARFALSFAAFDPNLCPHPVSGSSSPVLVGKPKSHFRRMSRVNRFVECVKRPYMDWLPAHSNLRNPLAVAFSEANTVGTSFIVGVEAFVLSVSAGCYASQIRYGIVPAIPIDMVDLIWVFSIYKLPNDPVGSEPFLIDTAESVSSPRSIGKRFFPREASVPSNARTVSPFPKQPSGSKVIFKQFD